MATIDWAQGITRGWKNPDNWAGGVVPSAGDHAVIEAAPASVTHGAYHVAIGSKVNVDTLVMDQANATLSIISTLTANSLVLDAGTVQLAGGSLTGTITDSQIAAGLEIKQGTTGTLSNVTWIEAPNFEFSPVFRYNPHETGAAGTLVIANSFAVETSDGGAGTAYLDGAVSLIGVNSLDNAEIESALHTITSDSDNFTFGAGLDLYYSNFNLTAANATLTNLGTIDSAAVTASVFINSGTLDDATINTGEFVNNGTIGLGGSSEITIKPLPGQGVAQIVNNGLIEAMSGYTISFGGQQSNFTNYGTVQVDTGAELNFTTSRLAAPGANAAILINGGVLGLKGPLTTAELSALLDEQKVTFTGGGVSIAGTLDNSNATLTLGSDFPTLFVAGYPSNGTTISGGILLNPGEGIGYANNTNEENLNLQGVAYRGTAIMVGQTLELGGRTTIDATDGTAGTLVLVNRGRLVLDADQTLSGVAIAFSNTTSAAVGPEIVLNEGAVLDNATLTLSGGSIVGPNFKPAGTLGANLSIMVSNDGSTGGARAAIDVVQNEGTITVAPGSYFDINTGLDGGSFDNSGTVTVSGGSTLVLIGTKLVNTGTFDVTDSTLILGGTTNLAALKELTLSDVQFILDGTLSLQGKTLALDSGGISSTTLLERSNFVDGTLVVSNGQTLLNGASPTDAFIQDQISATLVNNGHIEVNDMAVDNVSGTGTFDLSVSNNYFQAVLRYEPTAQGMSFGAGETVNFISVKSQLFFSTGASSSFAGTLQGFAVTDSVAFYGSGPATSANFVGDSIVVDFKNGTTATLATDTALSGQLSASTADGVTTVTYASDSPGLSDWSAPGPIHVQPAAETNIASSRLWQESPDMVHPGLPISHAV